MRPVRVILSLLGPLVAVSASRLTVIPRQGLGVRPPQKHSSMSPTMPVHGVKSGPPSAALPGARDKLSIEARPGQGPPTRRGAWQSAGAEAQLMKVPDPSPRIKSESDLSSATKTGNIAPGEGSRLNGMEALPKFFPLLDELNLQHIGEYSVFAHFSRLHSFLVCLLLGSFAAGLRSCQGSSGPFSRGTTSVEGAAASEPAQALADTASAAFGQRSGMAVGPLGGVRPASLVAMGAHGPRLAARRDASKQGCMGRLLQSQRAASSNDEEGSKVKQLLGMKGASDTEEEPLWKIRLQLCKPVTWPPLLFGVVAGTCASGNFSWSQADYSTLFLAMVLSGPILVGYTQTLNDWYDKDIDAINEPYRPIPSGRITEEEVWQQITILGLAGLVLAAFVDFRQGHFPPTVFGVAAVGVLLAYIYSAPPLKLKSNWLLGCYALGSSYIALPWWAGQSAFGQLTPEIIVFTLFYSIAGVGIAIVNDFKSVEGDSKLGLDSAPVVFGTDTAKYMAPAFKDITQLCVAAWLVSIGETYYALGLLVLVLPQIYFATQFVKDPIGGDVKYQASSLPLFSIGTIVTACAIGANPYH